MKAHAQAWRIGLFALGGLGLLAAAVVAVFGLRVFQAQEAAVLHFAGSVHGLQIGAPVVFRGVRVGGVQQIGLALVGGRPAVPVQVRLDRQALLALAEPGTADPLPALLRQGLVAQLATQSLLTGQLYVDLDLAAGTAGPAPTAVGPIPVIPTRAAPLDAWREQLAGIDLARLATELSQTLAATRALVAGASLQPPLAELSRAAATLTALAQTLQQRLPPLADAAQGSLREAGDASRRVAMAADRVGAAAQQADRLLAPESALVGSVRAAADELARSASALREATASEAPTVQGLQRALGDVSRAARAVRALAEQIEEQPQSLIRGKAVP